MASPSNHAGHGARNTNCPREKTAAGYLNRNSNIEMETLGGRD
jgi:hypothetical protein